MGIKKIVLAYDGSDNSANALKWTVDFALQTGADTDIVMVLEKPTVYPLEEIGQYIHMEAAYKEKLTMLINTAAETFQAQKLKERSIIISGSDPAEEIINYAQQNHADLIVCGTRGFGGFKSLLIGSVAHRLVTYSNVPVLVIRSKKLVSATT
ncbi:MAG TPA: universal stress protein [Patescibacteria group bacterium]|nr:universal stress protein [Patescibacteria group bacterium]